MEKFTPGPWEAWLGNATFGVTGPSAAAGLIAARALEKEKAEHNFTYHFVELGSIHGECPGIALGDTKESAEANAKLIAAAPMMLSFLEQIERLSREADGSLVDVRALLGDIARKALARTKGE